MFSHMKKLEKEKAGVGRKPHKNRRLEIEKWDQREVGGGDAGEGS